jgi:hypothetical protein
LLVFPTGFYLAQVYTEGLFIGLAFMACALAVEKKIVAAAIFAVFAAVTRQAGVFLFIPLAWAAFQILRDGPVAAEGLADRRADRGRACAARELRSLVLLAARPELADGREGVLLPLVRHPEVARPLGQGLGQPDLRRGQDRGRGWLRAVRRRPLPSSSTVYLSLEFLSVALGVVACVWLLRRMPGVALFGLAVIILSAGSSGAQGMDRYVLAVPAIFLMLASFGRRAVFDRAWVMASTLLMGMLVMLFTFGFWVS